MAKRITTEQARARLFAGSYPCGIVYADRGRERAGDYARCAFLSYATLELEMESDCPRPLADLIRKDAAKVQARAGEAYQVSTAGQTVQLGDAMPFADAKAVRDRLEAAAAKAGAELRALSGGGAAGLTSDDVKATPEWQAARAAYQNAHTVCQRFNRWFTAAFKGDLREERRARRAGR